VSHFGLEFGIKLIIDVSPFPRAYIYSFEGNFKVRLFYVYLASANLIPKETFS